MSLTVRVDPAQVALSADQQAVVTVTIANASDRVEHYVVELRGLPEGTVVQTSPEVCKLQPAATGQVVVSVTADPVRPPIAGRQVVGVTASSPYRPEVTRTAELGLEVLPAPALELALAPEVVSGGDRDVTVDLLNQGNTPLDVELGGQDAEGRVTLVFAPRSVRLAPRAEARVQLQLRARRPLSGIDVRRQVSVVATSQADERRAAVVLVQRPWVPGGVTRLIAAASGVAVLAAAVITSAVLVVGKLAGPTTPASDSTSQQSTTPSQPGQTKSGDTPSTSGGPGSGPATSTAGQPGQPGQPVVVGLSAPPPGLPTANQRLLPDAYPGLNLSALPDPAVTGCADVTSVSFLILRNTGGAVVAGTFSQDAAGTPTGKCNTLAVRVGFTKPVSQATIQLLGAQTGGSGAAVLGYSVTPQPVGTAVQVALAPGLPGSATVTDTTGQGISAVVVSGLPAGGSTAPVLTQVTYTPVAAPAS